MRAVFLGARYFQRHNLEEAKQNTLSKFPIPATDWWVTFEKDNPQPPHAEHLMNFYYNKVWKRTQEYLQDLAEEDHYEPLAR